MQVELSKILIGLLLAICLSGCGESVSEKSANAARDALTEEQEKYVDKRFRALEESQRELEERVTALEKR